MLCLCSDLHLATQADSPAIIHQQVHFISKLWSPIRNQPDSQEF